MVWLHVLLPGEGFLVYDYMHYYQKSGFWYMTTCIITRREVFGMTTCIITRREVFGMTACIITRREVFGMTTCITTRKEVFCI